MSDDLFACCSGPRNAKIMIIGEAWGKEESIKRQPFVGYSGQELDKMLFEAGLTRAECLVTNVVEQQPPANDFTHFLYPNPKRGDKNGSPSSLYRQLYLRPALKEGLERLNGRIQEVNPRLIIGCGNIPLWALTDHASVRTNKGYKLPGGITSWHGSETNTIPIGNRTYPYLPIIHPAAITRQWGYRPITIQNLRRATGFIRGTRDWGDPLTFAHPSPSWDVAREWLLNLRGRIRDAQSPVWISVDLETYGKRFISVVGLAIDEGSICLPLFYFDDQGKNVNYWTIEQEQWIWRQLRYILHHPMSRVIGQNFMYDIEWFQRYYGFNFSVDFDTMVAHHVCYPGTPKALHDLARQYCDHYKYWKDESGEWAASAEDAHTLWSYNCKDTTKTYEIAFVLMGVLTTLKKWPQYQEKLDQWALAVAMRRRGTKCNVHQKSALRKELMEAANELQQWLFNAVPSYAQYTKTGKPWFASNQGCARLFYEILKIPPIKNKKTGAPTLDADALEELKNRYGYLGPLIEHLLALRSTAVFISHFIDAKLSPDGRIRATFKIDGTKTHRWSSSETGFAEGTNLQNVPKGDED